LDQVYIKPDFLQILCRLSQAGYIYMNDQERTNRISPILIAAVSAVVIAVSGGIAWFSSHSSNSPTPVNPSQNLPQRPLQQQHTARRINQQTAHIYWIKPVGTKLELVSDSVKVNTQQPKQALETAFQTLLAGPADQDQGSTTIPQGTKLLGLEVNGNIVHVNLSHDFITGGGSTSMMGRIGQVVYTATTLRPRSKVYIEVNGKQLDVLGGEGVELQQPLTREKFKQDYQL
jgi:spore germination protein GerM